MKKDSSFFDKFQMSFETTNQKRREKIHIHGIPNRDTDEKLRKARKNCLEIMMINLNLRGFESS